tara:strand:+ start:2033 stop:3304 length:1272 start_codon:yes stop_codon:yes gene_type:complete
MSSNFIQFQPPKSKALQSGSFLNQGIGIKSNINDNASFNGNTFNTSILGSNVAYPFNFGVQTVGVATDYANFGSNSMVASGDFNIIKTSINNYGAGNIKLRVLYNHDQNIKTSVERYSTTIKAGELFYRNYPVENEYFSMSIENTEQAGSTGTSVKGKVTLSKFTQFNAPAQVEDTINRFALADLSRATNEFKDDILIDRIEDINKATRLGIVDTIQSLEQTIYNEGQAFNFTSNTSQDVVIRSTEASDSGKDVLITGLGIGDTTATDRVTLTGTSNAFSVSSFKWIDNMTMVDSNNSGKLTCASVATGEVYNVMDADAGRSTSLIYGCPTNKKSVLKDIKINGRSGLECATKINLYKVKNNLYKTLLYKNNAVDSELNNYIKINEGLSAGDLVYGTLTSANTASALGDSAVSVLMNVYEYDI